MRSGAEAKGDETPMCGDGGVLLGGVPSSDRSGVRDVSRGPANSEAARVGSQLEGVVL